MSRSYIVTVNGKQKEVMLVARKHHQISFIVDGERHDLTIAAGHAHRTSPTHKEVQNSVQPTPTLNSASTPAQFSSQLHASSELRAPMPGVIVKISATPGEMINSGTIVVVLEAMKMENPLSTLHGGVVDKVHVVQGAEVEGGALLITFKE